MNHDLPELSFVIPAYNSSGTIGEVVNQIHDLFNDIHIEVVVVNDGSHDDTELRCNELLEKYPETMTFLHLARNFGEHNAVLAGLRHSSGHFVAVLDDDGQNPPAEVRKMYTEITTHNYDVVYGKYRVKRHGRMRNLGSWFNDRMANVMLKKPRDLYLSSFKIMNRFIVDEIMKYDGPFPYVDGLILRATRNFGQTEVEHLERSQNSSNYTLRKMIGLWLNMFLNFSITPLRFAVVLGSLTATCSLFLLAAVIIDKLYVNPEVAIGLPTTLVVILFFSGVQLVILGTIGEYLGRLFLDHTKKPQYVVRYCRRGPSASE